MSDTVRPIESREHPHGEHCACEPGTYVGLGCPNPTYEGWTTHEGWYINTVFPCAVLGCDSTNTEERILPMQFPIRGKWGRTRIVRLSGIELHIPLCARHWDEMKEERDE